MSSQSPAGSPPQRVIGLIGLGPHAQRVYFPMLEREAARSGLRLGLLVELDDKIEEVKAYLASRALQPERIVFLPASRRDGLTLDPSVRWAAGEAMRDGMTGVIIATEPRSHLVYARWAIQEGLHVLIDKPLTAIDLSSADPLGALSIVDHYFELLHASRSAGTSFLVQTQRRAHPGYQMLHRQLGEFTVEHGVPVTYVDISHGDGMWNTPNELTFRENHPYKYGYGKLMHSGYHFVDLFSWLVEVNDHLPACAADHVDLDIRHANPYDHLHQVRPEIYERFFGPAASTATDLGSFTRDDLRRFGELDVFATLQFMRDDAVITTGTLNLMQTTFSRRAWPTLPQDTYKANGRVRHERVVVQVGPLLAAHVHSYQAYESKERHALDTGPGSYDHFDLSFYRNSGLVGGAPVEHIAVGEQIKNAIGGEAGYLGHNEAARGDVFSDFLAADGSRAGLESHELAVKLLAACYYGMLSRNAGRPLSPRISLRPEQKAWVDELQIAVG